MRLLKALLIISVMLSVLLGSGWLFYTRASQQIIVQTPLLVDIPKGASFKQIVQVLQQQQIALNPFWFKIIAYRYQLRDKLQAGEYELNAGLTSHALLQQLAEGRVKQYAITFPEGWTFKEILKQLAQAPKLEHLLTSNDMFAVLTQLGIDKTHAEGWFFPDTYHYTKGTTDITILQRAYQKMQVVLAQEWQHKQPGLPLKTPYQALTLASIIEKETGVASERPAIAGVFTRRLQKNMLLQTDPTVIYGMGERYQGNIRTQDLKTLTPYNTYIINGLPPTPIAQPGLAAIHAALHPHAGDALYFVAKGNGEHHFSSTLTQHNAAVDKYQRNQHNKSKIYP